MIQKFEGRVRSTSNAVGASERELNSLPEGCWAFTASSISEGENIVKRTLEPYRMSGARRVNSRSNEEMNQPSIVTVKR
jgi:hypothetical protein